VGIITGGLVFHAGVHRHAGRRDAPPRGDVANQLFTAAFLLGPFTEAVTGFGVGTVFAVGAVRALGVAGAPAAAIGLMAQPIIPWGGLGPGTAIGAALAGIDPQGLAARNAMMLASSLLLLLPLFWWWCALAGVSVSWPTRLRQTLWVGAVGVLLVLGHAILPWQLCGMLATGLVLAVRLLASHPPQSRNEWGDALLAAGPYLLLAGLLLASQLWRNPPSWSPFDGLPSLPLNHAMSSIWLAALIMLLAGGRGPGLVVPALRKARRPALALLSFVVLARVLSNAGIPVALAGALVAGFGSAAPFASPVLAIVSGFFAGTNVGGNSAMMPLQAALGRAAGLGANVLPAVQNGTLALVISPQLVAVAAGLTGHEVTPAMIWRIMWPVALIALVVGIASIVIG
jgi:lactate permease